MDSSTEGLLSSMLDFYDAVVEYDDMDMAAQKSHYKATFLKGVKIGDLSDAVAYGFRLFTEVSAWIIFEIGNGQNALPFATPKRDYRLIDAAYRAAYKSFQLVVEELGQPNAYRHFSTKKTIKSLCKRVLASFDLFCKNLSIENSFDAVNLRSLILEAADLAKEYISQETDQIQLPENNLDETANSALWLLFASLNWKYVTQATSRDMQQVAKATDDNIVGLDGDLIKIKELLQGNIAELNIISIVGMGGMGKTTLTSRVYEEPQIMDHFHVHAWTIVSQEYHERDVLLGILQSIAPLPEEVCKESKEQLAERLYRRLKGWKYFIVLDDVWTKEAWNKIKLCFPDDGNGSRIIITTRITEVASYVSSSEDSCHFMNFLDLDDSWNLLCKQVFGKEAFPPHLVNVGKQIAEKCQGLPLAIKAVAGYLSNLSQKQECWEDVAGRVGLPTEVSQMESLLSILSLSYNCLPQQLKACFLTMVTFPKNFEIPARKLVALWASMGFLDPIMPDTKEELAMKCLEDLIGRSLIMVKKRKFDGKVKLCGIHDLLWDLGIREARKEGNSVFGNISLRHSYFTGSDDLNYAMGLSRILRYFDCSFESDCPIGSLEFKSITVLDILNESFDHFPEEITELVNLKYLSLAASGSIPESLSKLCNLEVLINDHSSAAPTLPIGIWSLERLRHLHVGTFTYLSEPPSLDFEGSSISGLPHLQYLSILSSDSCTKEVLLKIPNLKELRMLHETDEEGIEDELRLIGRLSNLACLNQLEVFKLCCISDLEQPRNIPHWDSFIPNIKQLTLVGGYLPWSKINALAMLPNLEVLKLKKFDCVQTAWEVDDEEFLQLKCLVLDTLTLESWNANEHHFPNLQCLVITDCPGLMGFPTGFGELPALQLIELESYSAVIYEWARQIQREQLDNGNDKLIIHTGCLRPEGQVPTLAFGFVYMNSRLQLQRAKKVRSKKWKGKQAIRTSEVSVGESSSNSNISSAE